MEQNCLDESSLPVTTASASEVRSNASSRRNSSEESNMDEGTTNLQNDETLDDSSDDGNRTSSAARKKRVQRFSDSDRDEVIQDNDSEIKVRTASKSIMHDSEGSSDEDIFKNAPRVSRIRKVSSSESDDEHDKKSKDIAQKNEEQQSRMKNKRNKMKQKFKSLVHSRGKEENDMNVDNQVKIGNSDIADSECSDQSDNDASSIENIKKIIKERSNHLKSTIYDPDTSDEDQSPPKQVQKQNKGRKSTKLTSPKPMRMSAKEAMENMQKIKSESNRMLREKEVSLPYHRPKALSLKDIMSRRRPAVSSDGKALPIKMNEEQLKQYALLLEQRQKDMMELCKSESEEDISDKDNGHCNNNDKNGKTDDLPSNENVDNDTPNENKDTKDSNPAEMSLLNDSMYDDIVTSNAETSNVDNLIIDEESVADTDHDLIPKGASDTINSPNDATCHEVKEKHSDINEEKNDNDTTEEVRDSNVAVENTSEEIELVYNDSVEDCETVSTIAEMAMNDNKIIPECNEGLRHSNANKDTESDSQLISLHYDSEKFDGNTELEQVVTNNVENAGESIMTSDTKENNRNEDIVNDFSDDDDVNMEDIDALIENAEIIASQNNGDCMNSPMLIRDPQPLKTNPKLTGAPGMVIDLDGCDPCAPKKLSGVELLKERFIYFAKLKTPEELERAKEKKIKPGMQHIKLKQELEDQIAEQRSLEWAKRLEDEKRQQIEMNAIRGDGSDAEEDLEKIKANLEENGDVGEKESSSESEEELEEEIYDVEEKPRKRNPLVADEAEESDCDDDEGEPNGEINENNEDEVEEEKELDDDIDEDESEESSEDPDDEEESKPKKGRILKAFEDSDDEETSKTVDQDTASNNLNSETNVNEVTKEDEAPKENSPVIKETQDDDLQLAQMDKCFSDDLFNSQSSGFKSNDKADAVSSDDKELGTQSFSILNSDVTKNVVLGLKIPEKFPELGDTQSYEDGDLDAVVGMCSGSFSQSLVPPTSQFPIEELTQSQAIGGDILALCTGQFYDNQFVSQLDDGVTQKGLIPASDLSVSQTEDNMNIDDVASQEQSDAIKNVETNDVEKHDTTLKNTTQQVTQDKDKYKESNTENKLLNSILDELNDPEFEAPKTYKYFIGNNQDKENKSGLANSQFKKKFVIDSDDEDDAKVNTEVIKKKLKKKKAEKRALQISDDEEDELSEQEEEDMSEIEEDNERLVEYDSEENEIAIDPQQPKKKRKVADFFEQEAELSSEDEWAGSGDEDEAGLDRMEREEGDNESFHQGKLQRELGQIHMRDVMDQDRREVRLIQELLLEDGDLGGGHRQRKFRWRNAEDGEEEEGASYSEFDTQEEEFESEEQWRKQRHEREMFLKQMQKDETEDSPNISINRSTIVKANLCSRTMSNLLLEFNDSKTENTATPAPEKKLVKNIPSVKEPFLLSKQSYHGSLLTRGQGALARLAALATPLAADDDAPKVGSIAPTSKRNFVFAALTPEEKPKVTKRKAEANVGTPKLVKKMKTEERRNPYKTSLLDLMKA